MEYDSKNCIVFRSDLIAPMIFQALSNYEDIHTNLKAELIKKLNSKIKLGFIDRILGREKKVVTNDNIFDFLYEGYFLSDDGVKYVRSVRKLNRFVELYEFVTAFEQINSSVHLSEEDITLIKEYV